MGRSSAQCRVKIRKQTFLRPPAEVRPAERERHLNKVLSPIGQEVQARSRGIFVEKILC